MIRLEREDNVNRVALHPVHQGHLKAMLEWRNTPEIRQWCRQEGLISDRDQAAWYARQNDDSTMRMFSVAAGDEHVGTAGLTSIDWIHRRAEFSLYIAGEYQGKGYGGYALKTLFWHGFNDLNLHLIWGETFDGNPAAKMFEKFGMVHEGTRRDFYFANGRYINAHLYSLKSSEFSL